MKSSSQEGGARAAPVVDASPAGPAHRRRLWSGLVVVGLGVLFFYVEPQTLYYAALILLPEYAWFWLANAAFGLYAQRKGGRYPLLRTLSFGVFLLCFLLALPFNRSWDILESPMLTVEDCDDIRAAVAKAVEGIRMPDWDVDATPWDMANLPDLHDRVRGVIHTRLAGYVAERYHGSDCNISDLSFITYSDITVAEAYRPRLQAGHLFLTIQLSDTTDFSGGGQHLALLGQTVGPSGQGRGRLLPAKLAQSEAPVTDGEQHVLIAGVRLEAPSLLRRVEYSFMTWGLVPVGLRLVSSKASSGGQGDGGDSGGGS